MDGDTKVFDLTVDPIKHQIDAQTEPLDALGFNGTWPGPRIDVTEGDKIRATFTNRMAESTGIHFHGQRLPNAMDGVPHVTQDPIPPGGSFTYEFVAKSSGSHMYHSHHNATDQVGRGLLGAFIVQPKDPAQRYDKLYGATQDIVWISNDALGGFTINGRGFPATAPIVATLGETIVIRFMNEGNMMHPWHLHGMPMRVVARDGHPLGSAAFTCDTLGVNPGERWDVVIDLRRARCVGLPLPHPPARGRTRTACTAWSPRWSSRIRPRPPSSKAAGAPAFACVVPARAARPDQADRPQPSPRGAGRPAPAEVAGDLPRPVDDVVPGPEVAVWRVRLRGDEPLRQAQVPPDQPTREDLEVHGAGRRARRRWRRPARPADAMDSPVGRSRTGRPVVSRDRRHGGRRRLAPAPATDRRRRPSRG